MLRIAFCHRIPGFFPSLSNQFAAIKWFYLPPLALFACKYWHWQFITSRMLNRMLEWKREEIKWILPMEWNFHLIWSTLKPASIYINSLWFMTYIFDAPSASLQHSHCIWARFRGADGRLGVCVCLILSWFRFGITSSEPGALSSRKNCAPAMALSDVQHG